MSDLYENAINSIKLGIEDFKSNDERRPVSAVRNFYAGILLLGKDCLLAAAPEADQMEVLASKFVPVPDDDGGVTHQPKRYRTIDLGELKDRFKSFDLSWPDGEIKSLQKVRNDFEHFHSPAPTEAIQQAIAECFPLVEGFFALLEKDPSSELGDTWDTMLAEEAFFKKQKTECDSSFDALPWGGSFTNSEGFSCSDCGSSLIFQTERSNTEPSSIHGKCRACGHEMDAEKVVLMVVEAEFGIDDYIAAKDGGEPTIHDCMECGLVTYVFDGETDMCYFCEEVVTGECGMCNEPLTVTNQSVNTPSLCDYCDHRMHKIMKE